MPAGILNKSIVDYETNQLLSVDEVRDRILGRNLPPPIPFELRDTEFTSYLQNLGTVINIPLNPANEYVTFDEENSLETIGSDERDVTLNYNPYIGNEDSYYEYIFPSQDRITEPRLEDAYSQYISNNSVKGFYPYYSTNDKFKLLSSGDKIGRRDPYGVIETSDINTGSESGLGIIGLEQLNNSIITVTALKEIQQNQDVPNIYVDGLTTNSVKSYRISEDTSVNRGVEYTQFLKGETTYKSILPNEAVGWNEYSVNSAQGNVLDILGNLGVPSNTSLSTEGRSVEMLLKTSDGQKLILYSNFSNNKYIPNYQDPRIVELLGDNTPNSRYYIGDEKSTNRGDTVTKVFSSEQFNDGEGTPQAKTTINSEDNFLWKLDGGEFNEKTILQKTQNIVNNNSDRVFIDQTATYFKDTRDKKYISRGSAIKRREEDATSYFRVWTKENEYSYNNALKGMDNGNYLNRYKGGREKAHLSVLGINGLPKVHPTPLDAGAPLKKYMLSIENLAWAGYDQELPQWEKGNGDPATGTRGRIMWFAPYDLQFDENVSANWTATDFLGRGEPVYTYNNTKRSGQLRFKIIVDHPSLINEYRGRQSNLLEKFFAGGRTTEQVLEDFLGLNLFDLNTERAIELAVNEFWQQIVSRPRPNDAKFTILFNPDSSNINDITDTSLNPNLLADIDSIKSTLENASDVEIRLDGYAGIYPLPGESLVRGRNKAGDRIDAVKTYLEGQDLTIAGDNNQQVKVKPENFKRRNRGNSLYPYNQESLVTLGELDGTDKNIRRVDVIVRYTPAEEKNIDEETVPQDQETFLRNTLLNNISFNESNFFSLVDQNYPNYFKTISEKIKYFHPGFHSYTPESLNSRLTFLHQCTRQGNSINMKDANIKPRNLAFGKPPVCILRIGDFFHTKMVINSLSLSYGAGGGAPQWDLNPEGIGVQPMMVDVNLSIDIIGGQSLFAPINQLQNAMSFNFYANTEMYDPRSSNIIIRNGKPELRIPDYPKPNRVKTANQTESTDGDKPKADTNQVENSSNNGDSAESETTAQLIEAKEDTTVAVASEPKSSIDLI
jgi:hypothetical protein